MLVPHGMKYASIKPHEVPAYLVNDRYWMEQKLDGVFTRAIVESGSVRFTTVTGETQGFAAATQYSSSIAVTLRTLPDCVLEGELMIHHTDTHSAGTFIVFDMPIFGEIVNTATQFAVRRTALEKLFDLTGMSGNIRLSSIARTTDEKTAMWLAIKSTRGEGAVFKQTNAQYIPGPHRTKVILKAKLTSTLDVIVIDRNTENGIAKAGKLNATLGLVNDSGRIVEVGRCSMIGRPDMKIGEVIEVECLNVSDDGRLYQPRMSRPRPDKTVAECGLDQMDNARVNRAIAC